MRKKEDDLEALKQRNIKEAAAIDQAGKSARLVDKENGRRMPADRRNGQGPAGQEQGDRRFSGGRRESRHDELMDLKKTQYEQREQGTRAR